VAEPRAVAAVVRVVVVDDEEAHVVVPALELARRHLPRRATRETTKKP
jgi:hypothetical protein